MVAVVEMAKNKKTNEAAEVTAEEKKKNVKVTPEFHRRLKTISSQTGVDMGDIVEREVEEFLKREEANLKKRLPG